MRAKLLVMLLLGLPLTARAFLFGGSSDRKAVVLLEEIKASFREFLPGKAARGAARGGLRLYGRLL